MGSSTSEDPTESRFSTPEPNLDDHRNQPSSLPRVGLEEHSALPTSIMPEIACKTLNEETTSPARQNTLQVHAHPQQAGSSIARDFEHAIEEENDSKSANISIDGKAPDGVNSRASLNPVNAKPGIIRYGLHDRSVKSRSSSKSSRSTSPPNSVDAFADPRRRERAGTLESISPSDLNLTCHRTVSGGTHKRRPTFSEGHIECAGSHIGVSNHECAREDDVCYPPPDTPSENYIIDFEALEEFVAECRSNRPSLNDLTRVRQYSVSAQSGNLRVFKDLRKPIIPQIITPVDNAGLQSNADCAIEDEKSIMNEKHAKPSSGKTASLRSTSSRIPYSKDSNRFIFFSSELESTIHAREIGDLVMPGESFRDLFELSPEGGVWWLDVLNPTDEEINVIAKAFCIHPLTSEDIKTQEAREKVELFKQYYFVCFRSFFQADKAHEDYMKPLNVYATVFRAGAISFTFCPSPHAANVRKRIGRLRDYVSLSSDWICYALIDDIVDSFGPVIHNIENETDLIEDQVFIAREDDLTSLLRQVGECRKKVNHLMRLLGGKADVIKGFAKRCTSQYPMLPRADIGLYLGDIQDHVVTMMSNLAHFDKMLSRSHSNFLAQISVDNIVTGNRANEVLQKITLIASILVPLNLVCGLFGMNVPVPGRESTGLGWFFGIVGIMVAIVIAIYIAAKRNRFI
ncbi:MAG: Mg(2+) transporter [Trizodia sp. TS-e1964]|nr:MAG: Mg(2+) transporter [Trizodia sp. TS-e1964]